MEFLMVCTTNNMEGKKYIERIMNRKNGVKNLTWITGIDGQEKLIKSIPFIATSMRSIYAHKEQLIGFAMVPSINQVKKISKSIRKIKNNSELFNYCILPTIKNFGLIESLQEK